MNRLIRLNEVMNLTALSRSAIYRKMKTGEFPQSVNIGDRAVAWVEQDIKEWIAFVIERGSDDKRR
ncbi:AlpA family transcriptional regulator [Vibrio sp. PNB22_4_1]